MANCSCTQMHESTHSLCCCMQTGLERVVRMALTIGLLALVFQSQAQLDKKVNHDYIVIRK